MAEENKKQWYVVNTYAGHENRVKENLLRRVESMGLQDYLLFKLAIIVILSGFFNSFVQWLTEGGLSQMLLQLFGNLFAAVILAIVGIYARRHAK